MCYKAGSVGTCHTLMFHILLFEEIEVLFNLFEADDIDV